MNSIMFKSNILNVQIWWAGIWTPCLNGRNVKEIEGHIFKLLLEEYETSNFSGPFLTAILCTFKDPNLSSEMP